MASIERPQILIVGGEGFIGKYLSQLAYQQDYAVTVITRSPCENDNNKYEIIVCDICNRENLSAVLKNRQFHYVINCSGDIDHTLYIDGGRKLVEQHFIGVLNLVESIDRKKLKLFVQLGSSDEYGANDAPQVESQRESPISPYSLGKTAATHFLQMLFKKEKFPAVIYRLFLVYGPGQSMSRFIPQVINACLNDIEFPVSAGEQLRDFCYIDDICNTILKSLNNIKTHGNVINLGSGQAIKIKSVVEKIKTLAGGGKPIYGEIAYRDGENMSLYANTDKAKEIISWVPKTTFDEGLIKTIESYKY